MRTARAFEPRVLLLLLPLLLSSVLPRLSPASELSLEDAVRETLAANLDLAAQQRSLAADEQEIALARSRLLPQIGVGARAQVLDSDRTDADRGATTQESVTLSAQISQVLYDETDFADLTIQQHVYDGQKAEFESFRLAVVQDAADSFLELDRARTLLDVELRNRELTARNLETSRSRIAAGWSSEREILRWESQLAANDTSVVDARTQLLVNRFELNRARNQSAETAIDPVPAELDQYGFVYASEAIVEAISKPEGDRRLRDMLVRVGISRSPDLAALDAAVEAEERLMTSNRRAFWIPSVSLGAGANHLAARGSTDRLDVNKTEWTVGAGLTFPVLEGGAKFARLRQSGELLSSLRIQRRSTAQSIDQGIRAAFARASGSFAAIGFARRQEAAAQRNFDLVNDSYVLGVASILALLDGQAQLLAAQQAVTNALYAFLEDLIEAENQMALYPFLESESEMEELVNDFERQLQKTP